MKVFKILINSLIKENFYEKKKNNNILKNFFFYSHKYNIAPIITATTTFDKWLLCFYSQNSKKAKPKQETQF